MQSAVGESYIFEVWSLAVAADPADLALQILLLG
jgi:hypothetical protein